MLCPIGVTVIVILACIVFAGVFMYHKYMYFAKKGVRHPSVVPLFGNLYDVVMCRQVFRDVYKKYYRQFSGHRYFGIYDFFSPTVVIRDPELVKAICVKDFEYFMNHRVIIDSSADLVMGSNLFSMKDARWREMRSTMSPAFTGSKLRDMFDFIAEAMAEDVEALEAGEFEARDLMLRFTTDAIATVAFGLKINSIKNGANQFYKNALYWSEFGLSLTLKFFGYVLMPEIMHFFRIQLFDSKITNWFHDVIVLNIENRIRDNIHRPDLVNLIMEVIKDRDNRSPKENKHQRDHEIRAQSIVFFLAAFETTSTQLTMLCYELAVNPTIQNRLREEIDETRSANENLSFDTIARMKYLEMVVMEGLRMWPNLLVIDRVCNKRYRLEDFNGSKMDLLPGDSVAIPVDAIQHDPKYFPNPDTFDPERFSDENRSSIIPYTFLPFGIGPRGCIGSRLALMQMKMIIIHMLAKFEINLVAEKTQVPLNFKKGSITIRVEGGLWLTLKARS